VYVEKKKRLCSLRVASVVQFEMPLRWGKGKAVRTGMRV